MFELSVTVVWQSFQRKSAWCAPRGKEFEKRQGSEAELIENTPLNYQHLSI